jgi:hypothetical protein
VSLLAALIIGVLGFLPIADWIPGGSVAGKYSQSLSEWGNGTLIVAGVVAVVLILSRRLPLWRDGFAEPLLRWAERRPWGFALAVSALALTVYAAVAVWVFSGRPLTVDEIVQVIQARIFAGGRLWLPGSPYPEFTSMLNMVDADGRWYAQFPPGGPALLSLGVFVGAPWLIGPLCGAIAVGAFWSMVRVVEQRPGVAVGATLLFALAPFVVFMSGSHMNHAPTGMFVLLAMAALVRVTCATSSQPLAALGTGLSLGAAATIRPGDAAAFALPAAIWLAVLALRDRSRWRDLIAAGLGVVVPVAAMLWVNTRTTGAPFLFGYQVLWGKIHDPGFHQAPWGAAHTPAHGLELLNVYFLRMQTYLFEWPIPSLVPVIAALALARGLDAFDRYLLAATGLLAALYFAYWFDGFLYGPRFFFPLVPFLVLWAARLPAIVRERFGDGVAHRAVVWSYAASIAVAASVGLPPRIREYAHAAVPMRLDARTPARVASVAGALIFVRESWGTQLMARMWALGVTRPEAEVLYRRIDSCVLEETLTRFEQAGVRNGDAIRRLETLQSDSARVVRSPFSRDITERYLPGLAYSPRCVQRVTDDRAGFTLLAPALVSTDDGNIYVRDMHERNRYIAALYPGRPMYLLRPASNELGLMPQLYPIRSDSAMRVWMTLGGRGTVATTIAR